MAFEMIFLLSLFCFLLTVGTLLVGGRIRIRIGTIISRIRIVKAQKLTDPTDPNPAPDLDPEYWKNPFRYPIC